MEYFTNDRVHDYNGYRIQATDPFGLWIVTSLTGGVLPPCLKDQSFTGKQEAMKKIDWYVASQKEKEEKPSNDKNIRKVKELIGDLKE